MNKRVKTSLLIFTVLLIGFILGILANGAWQQQRRDHFRHLGPERQFEKIVENIIKPDEKQKRALDTLLQEHSKKIATIQEKRQSELMAVFDTLKMDFESILSEKQIERFQQHLNSLGERFVKKRVDQLDHELDLSDAQEEQIYQIFNRHKDFLPGFPHEKGMGPRKDMHKVIKAIEKEIETVLTANQVKKYRKYKEKRFRRMEGFRPDRGRGGEPRGLPFL